jgi:hypothetical protein
VRGLLVPVTKVWPFGAACLSRKIELPRQDRAGRQDAAALTNSRNRVRFLVFSGKHSGAFFGDRAHFSRMLLGTR